MPIPTVLGVAALVAMAVLPGGRSSDERVRTGGPPGSATSLPPEDASPVPAHLVAATTGGTGRPGDIQLLSGTDGSVIRTLAQAWGPYPAHGLTLSPDGQVAFFVRLLEEEQRLEIASKCSTQELSTHGSMSDHDHNATDRADQPCPGVRARTGDPCGGAGAFGSDRHRLDFRGPGPRFRHMVVAGVPVARQGATETSISMVDVDHRGRPPRPLVPLPEFSTPLSLDPSGQHLLYQARGGLFRRSIVGEAAPVRFEGEYLNASW